MRSWIVWAVAMGLAAVSAARAEGPRRFVALELFTSQGCSSCPPAERVFQALADDPDLPPGVVPLAFHVPYWNYIGWPDPFSQKRFEGRQRRYGASLRSKRIYTPQLVVNGKAHRVGPHDRTTLARVVEAASRPVPGPLKITARRRGERVVVEASIEFEEELGSGSYELLAAAYHHAPPTEVGRGENSGRSLHNPWTVRAIGRVAVGSGESGTVLAGTLELPLPPDMLEDDLGVAVLLQHTRSLEVFHAGRVDVPRAD